jgi:DNA-binding NarL/FixJ family response regulator
VQKILIADGTEGFRNQLRDVLASKYIVVCADDGLQAWELFRKLRPELLIIDLELPEMDGMTLLHRISSTGSRLAVIVLGRMLSDYAVDSLIALKVAYILRKPCKIQNVAEQAMALLRYQSLNGSPVQTAIKSILCDFGIPCDLSGGKYLLRAVMLMAQNPSQYITKELYPAVGKPFGKSGEQVERSIRNAVEKGLKNGDPLVWAAYFGANSDGLPKKPKNGDFIVKVMEILKNKL